MKTTTALRQLLRQPGIIVAPGAYDCLTAKLIEREGFPAVYMTGAGTAVTRVGKPDLGFATLTEMLANASAMASTVSVPLIADADTGYGGALNVYRTVQEYARAGVAALHIEDQAFPKRCGHLDGKEVVPVAEMVAKRSTSPCSTTLSSTASPPSFPCPNSPCWGLRWSFFPAV